MSQITWKTLYDLSINPSLVDFDTKAVASKRAYNFITPPCGWAVNNAPWKLTALGEKAIKEGKP